MNSLTEHNPAFTHCDGERGVYDYESAPGVSSHYVYRSECSVPAWIREDVYHIQVTDGCPCGCWEAQYAHPCIGHDELTGYPLEGPSRMWRKINEYREPEPVEPVRHAVGICDCDYWS